MDDIKHFILDKAQNRFDRFGFRKTTMDEISRDCKMSKKTIYSHFQDKQNLFDCLFVRESHKDIEAIFSLMGDIADPLERLMQLIRTAIEHFSKDTFLTRLLKNDEALFSALLNGKYHSKVTANLLEIIAAIIAEGKEKGRIRREVDEQVAAYIGLKLFEAFSYFRTLPFDTEKESRGFYTEALVDFYSNALVKR